MTRPRPPRRERDLQTAILTYLRAQRIPCWKIGSGAFRVGGRYVRMGQRGMSDILGILPGGRFLAVEVKLPGRPVSPEQRAFLELVRAAGGVGLVAYRVEDVAVHIARARI